MKLCTPVSVPWPRASTSRCSVKVTSHLLEWLVWAELAMLAAELASLLAESSSAASPPSPSSGRGQTEQIKLRCSSWLLWQSVVAVAMVVVVVVVAQAVVKSKSGGMSGIEITAHFEEAVVGRFKNQNSPSASSGHERERAVAVWQSLQ